MAVGIVVTAALLGLNYKNPLACIKCGRDDMIWITARGASKIAKMLGNEIRFARKGHLPSSVRPYLVGWLLKRPYGTYHRGKM